ncbi:MAG: SlyX family protein [Gammaproteobacteria bacterium]
MSDERINELETKIAFLESTVNTLNDQVYQQQRSLDELRTWCQTLAGRVKSLREGDEGSASEQHEVPPHY